MSPTEEGEILGMEESYQMLRDLLVEFCEETVHSPGFLLEFEQRVEQALELTDD